MISPNANKWLDLISYAEGTYDPKAGGRQYNIMFGGGKFNDLSRHPDTVVSAGGYNSAAAGAYQFMPATWASTGGGSMAPERQDMAALELIRRRGVDPDVDPINPQTVAKLSPEWASLPTLEGKSYYGQPVRSFGELSSFARVTPTTTTYQSAGSTQQPAPRNETPTDTPSETPTESGTDLTPLLLNLVGKRGGIERSASYLGDPVVQSEEESGGDLENLLKQYLAKDEEPSAKQLPVERSLPTSMLDSTVDGIQQLAKQAMASFTPGKSVL